MGCGVSYQLTAAQEGGAGDDAAVVKAFGAVAGKEGVIGVDELAGRLAQSRKVDEALQCVKVVLASRFLL